MAVRPLAVHAQLSERMRRIGMLGLAETDPEYKAHLTAFRQELKRLVWSALPQMSSGQAD